MCTKPLARLETYERYTNSKGGISYKAEFDSWGNVEHNMKYYQTKYRKVDQIPCGRCIECRLAYTRQKANQMYAEYLSRNKENCYFLTLTYNDENLKEHETVNTETGEVFHGISLCKEDVQKFWKRLRYYKSQDEISYVIAGEYGPASMRPHYHAIVYGLTIDSSKSKYLGLSETGSPMWTNSEIEKIWGNGQVAIEKVTWDTCAYVARYIMKKQYGQNKIIYDCMGVIPEFIQQSNKRPIGKTYYEKHKEELYKTDEFFVPGKQNIKTNKPPMYFDKMLKAENEDLYNHIKIRRKTMGMMNSKLTQLQSDKSLQEMRNDRHNRLERTFKDLRKEY